MCSFLEGKHDYLDIEVLSGRQGNTKGDVPHGCLFWCAKLASSKAGPMEVDEG
jgi:hypothetical protein